MSALDRAFIKAYAATASQVIGSREAAPRESVLRAARAPQPRSIESADTPEVLPMPAAPLSEKIAAVPRATHAAAAREASPVHPRDTRPTDNREPIAAAPHGPLLVSANRARQPATLSMARGGEKAPLSSFATRAADDESLRAVLEVEQLAWPKMCGDLLSRARRRWDAFADRVADHIAHGETCIAIASCSRGEGRTTFALTTARCLGARGVRTVVVDADFENPNLVESCELVPHAGWSDILEGDMQLGEALITSLADNVTLMPWRGRGKHVTRLNDTLRVASHFERLKERFELVVFDTMPLEGPTAFSSFARLAEAVRLDAVYLIYDSRTTTDEQLTEASAKLARAGTRVAGIIENFSAQVNLSDASPRGKLATLASRQLVPRA